MEAAALDHDVTILLLALGFSPKNIGYHYLRQALWLTLQDPSMLELITKNLYPDLAKTFGTKPTDIERTIRFTVGEWYKEKAPGTQIPVQGMGLFQIPTDCPSNQSLFKFLTTFLQEAHTSLS